jgi:hypothetical protein
MKSQKLSIYSDDENRMVEGMMNIASDPPWIIEFTALDIPKMILKNRDLFECLIDLRKELVKFRYRPLCNGARLNIHASSMSREICGGEMAYIIHMGEQARREDVVNIFEYAEPDLIVSVSEQQEFYHNWVKSLK